MGLRHPLDQAFGLGLQRLRLPRRQPDGKLLSPHAAEQGPGRQQGLQSSAEPYQHRIPGWVAELIIDLLEMIHVDQQQGSTMAGHPLLGLLAEGTTIEHPGQVVMARHLLQAREQLIPLGHGAGGGDGA